MTLHVEKIPQAKRSKIRPGAWIWLHCNVCGAESSKRFTLLPVIDGVEWTWEHGFTMYVEQIGGVSMLRHRCPKCNHGSEWHQVLNYGNAGGGVM